jgi:PKD repeat protein
LYYNTAFIGANYLDSIINYSCTTPLPYGEGNINDDPLLITSTHIPANSPCLGKGSSKYAIGVDIDGEQWLDPPAMGADEYMLGNASGEIVVSIDVNYTNIATGFAISFIAQNQGAISATVWDFGDGTTVSNRAFVNHSWTTPGDYIVRLTGYNDSFPSGSSATVIITVSQSVFYVNAENSSPSFPYSSWETAAQTIQDAIDAGTLPGRLILVTNGIYDTGGSADYGRVILTNAAIVKSANGPTETFIVGSSASGGAIRCAYIVRDAVLSGFTLTNGSAQFGGGVLLETGGVVSNCVLVGNSAGFGGGAYFGTLYNYLFSDYYGLQCETFFYSALYNCALINNSASWNGGGAENVTLYDCILAGNTSGNSGGAACNSTLYNCTLTNNLANMNGGGVYWCTLNNCGLTNNFAGNCGGGAFNSIVYNCALINNSAKSYGGGAYFGMLYDCILTKNSAYCGGGAYSSTNYDCTFTENSADLGGGAFGCTLYNCKLNYNSAKSYGGGAYLGALYNCSLNRNSANEGGGAYNSTNYNSALTCNSAFNGGGAYLGEFYNCTLTGNSARYDGGGVYGSKLYNCIVYYNKSPVNPNYYNSILNYSCADPLPVGEGNITDEPLLFSATHISASSPCIGKGSSQYASGVDIDGEQWLNPPSMGADEYVSDNIKGTLIVSIDASRTNVPTGFSVLFVAQNQGPISAIVWDFGNDVIISNQPCISYSWNTPGDYIVRLTGYNDSFPSGVSATAVVKVVSQPVHYVNAKSASPSYPYLSWETAARTIQEAVDAAQSGDVVLVTNGVYNIGGVAIYGQMTNRVVLNKEVIVKSVNGPAETFIVGSAGIGGGNGDGAIRCAYIGTNAILSGFTLTNGHTRASGDSDKEQSGGGVWCDVGGIVSNCVLIGNSAQNNGGGAYGSTLYNCIVISNSVRGNGGGTYYSTLYNCTLTGNSAKGNGGGVCSSALYNCIVYYNLSTRSTNYYESTFRYSCVVPLPDGVGNISDEPLFASATHLSANSPCLGKGNSIYARGVDIDGEPWLEPPAMGADQYVPDNAKGPLAVSIDVRDTNIPTGFKVSFVAQAQGLISSSVWDFGDGITVSNQAYISHSWSSAGIYTVRLTGYNDSLPSGVSDTVQINVVNQPVFYVDCESKSPTYPYSSWETAANNIQDAIDASDHQEGSYCK